MINKLKHKQSKAESTNSSSVTGTRLQPSSQQIMEEGEEEEKNNGTQESRSIIRSPTPMINEFGILYFQQMAELFQSGQFNNVAGLQNRPQDSFKRERISKAENFQHQLKRPRENLLEEVTDSQKSVLQEDAGEKEIGTDSQKISGDQE